MSEQQLELGDDTPGLVRNDHRATAKVAAATVLTGRARVDVLRAIWKSGAKGATDEELVGLTGRSPSTVRPRRVELAREGWIVSLGGTRPSHYGKPMQVWVCSLAGEQALLAYDRLA